MGQTVWRWVGIVAGVVLVIVGLIQLATGLGLFGPPSLPDCDNADATMLVDQIVTDNFQLTVTGLSEIVETAADDTAQTRTCTATLTADQGSYDVTYALSWQDRENAMLYAEVQIAQR